ncbi:TIGR02444 family protein [Pseudomonas putida CSV86]|uniref:TIGR02444 family protein n=1 Tax=Pseudomonas bharatica CSV86 TaxID=1005395 RepID=L1M5Z7_9PSED|nr:TIGR02444 family protein [Pseudomonas bharatica]NNJ18543.1 TIGR02444 family protein [Pseudomonas bharatica CSV86]
MHTDLWDFAVGLYARPGVETACLELQALGADVCLLLCGAWLEQRCVALSDERVEGLRQLARPWQTDVVRPLRALRQQWRADALKDAQLAALRERLKALELDAERLQLQRLQDMCSGWPNGAEAPSESWLARLAPAASRDRDALRVLRVAAGTTQEAEDGV